MKYNLTRKTNEVDIKGELVFDPVAKGCSLKIEGTGDLRHHLLEDTIIMLKEELGGHSHL